MGDDQHKVVQRHVNITGYFNFLYKYREKINVEISPFTAFCISPRSTQKEDMISSKVFLPQILNVLVFIINGGYLGLDILTV